MRSIISRIAILTLVAGSSASAQLGNASTAATGLGGAFTARAQGYNAVFWNPANLGMPGNQGFSFTIGALDGNAGIRPIDLAKLAPYSGDTIPRAIREQWILDVETEGTQNGGIAGGVTELGLSLGPIAFQVNTKLTTTTNLNGGATELLLFGNEGRTGTLPANLNLAGSDFMIAGYTTAAAGYGMRLPLIPLKDFAIGVTAKYTVGHFLMMAQDDGSNLGNVDPMTIRFPYIRNDSVSIENKDYQLGSGLGIDLGAAWQIPGFRFGLSVQNVMNTFKWDTTKFAFGNAVGLFSTTADPSVDADSTLTPFSTAPAALRDRVNGMKFKPVIAAGVSFDWFPRVTVSADIRQQVAGGIEVGPESMIAAGAELRLIPFIPLRGGVQMMSGGFGVAGGVGLRLLGLEAGLAGYVRTRNGSQESGATINFISIRP